MTSWTMRKTSRPHDEAVVELLREDPSFSVEYLALHGAYMNLNLARKSKKSCPQLHVTH